MPRVSPNTTQQCEFAESLLTLSEPGPDGVVGPRPGPRSMLRRSAPARNTRGDTFRLPRTRSAWAFAPTLADRFWLAIGVRRIEARPARASSSPQEASGGRGRQPHYAGCGTPLPGSGACAPRTLDGRNTVLRPPSGQKRTGRAVRLVGAGPVRCRTQLYSFPSLPKEANSSSGLITVHY
jgi:hypothetical protein